MTWFRLDDQGAFHAKVIAVGNEAYGAWCRAGQWSSDHLTDGQIPTATAHLIASRRVWKKLVETIPEGHTIGLATETARGYAIHDYLVYNPSAEQVRAERAARSEIKQAAGRRGGLASGQARAKQKGSKDEAGSQAAGKQNEAPGPGPGPVPKERSEIPLPPVGLPEMIDQPESPERVVDVGTARAQAACETFVSALADRGWTRGEVREPWERRALCDAINAHLRADGTAEGMLAELRRAVGDWAAAKADAVRFTSGWGARKFADWLAEGWEPSTGVRPVAPTSDVRPVAEPEREYTPEEIAAADAAVDGALERLENAHRTPKSRPQRVASPTSSGDVYEQTAAEREAARQRQLAALAAITADESPRVA